MLLISMYYYFLWFRDLRIEQRNKQAMINILQGRTLPLSILKITKKVQTPCKWALTTFLL